jgi:hypothetical protein
VGAGYQVVSRKKEMILLLFGFASCTGAVERKKRICRRFSFVDFKVVILPLLLILG